MAAASDSIHLKSIDTVVASAEEKGFAFFEGSDIAMPESFREAFAELSRAYGELQKNRFGAVKNGFAGFGMNRNTQTLEFIVSKGEYSCNPDALSENNRELRERLYANPCLQKIVDLALRLIPGHNSDGAKCVNVLMTRHEISVSGLRPHQDGFCDWLVQFNIQRSESGVAGGAVQFYEVKETSAPIAEKLLVNRFDGYVLNDNRFAHGVTPIEFTEEGAVRDVLIIRPHRDR